MKPNIDNKGRVARGGMAVVFLLFGARLIPEAPVFAAIFSLIGLFCAFEAWIDPDKTGPLRRLITEISARP